MPLQIESQSDWHCPDTRRSPEFSTDLNLIDFAEILPERVIGNDEDAEIPEFSSDFLDLLADSMGKQRLFLIGFLLDPGFAATFRNCSQVQADRAASAPADENQYLPIRSR